MKNPAFIEKMARGPIAFMTVRAGGSGRPTNVIRWGKGAKLRKAASTAAGLAPRSRAASAAASAFS